MSSRPHHRVHRPGGSNEIILHFPVETANVVMSPEQARAAAAGILRCAEDAKPELPPPARRPTAWERIVGKDPEKG